MYKLNGGWIGEISRMVQDDSKAYEITKNIVVNSLEDIIKLHIICEILLIIGYRRKEEK